MADMVYTATVTGSDLARALGKARGFAGREHQHVYMEFARDHLTVVATDGHRFVAVRVKCQTNDMDGQVVAIAEADVARVAAFCVAAEARDMTMAVGGDFVGLSTGKFDKLMVNRAQVPILPWRERIVGRHQPGAQFSFESDVLRSALAPVSGRVIFHLPDGDGQAAHLYHPDSDTEVWVMPTASSVAGVANQVKQEGGQAEKEPENVPTEPME